MAFSSISRSLVLIRLKHSPRVQIFGVSTAWISKISFLSSLRSEYLPDPNYGIIAELYRTQRIRQCCIDRSVSFAWRPEL